MAIQKYYGEATFTDIGDVGRLTAYLTSNQPMMVVYDPNNTQSPYTPNWATSALQITPVIFFNEKQLANTESGVVISWERRAGSGTSTGLIAGETVENGALKVSKNVLADILAGLITYICNIDYTDPNTQIKISTQAVMSFSLVKNATELKDCSITGENTFLYKGDGTLISASKITLTATLTNTSISQWQYKNTDGSFTVYPGSTTGNTLTVAATDKVFVNDVAIIKLCTTDPAVYDLHQIVKIKDGAAGSSTYTCVLSDDSQVIPVDSNGNLYPSSLTGCETTISILKGATEDRQNWTIVATPSSGIQGTYTEETYTYKVTGMTVESGYVEFVATRSGHATITKRFSLSKQRAGGDGADAAIYQLKSNVSVMTLNASKVLSPASVIFNAYKRIGNSVAASNYAGRFKISETTNGTTWTLKYTSAKDENTTTYTPSTTSLKSIKCELYSAGGTTTLLDTQSVAIVSDGKDGSDGAQGDGAVNVVLGNVAELIPCNPDGKVKTAKDITIPYSCYKGLQRVAGAATLNTLPTGITLKSNTNATASSDGIIVLSVAAGATLASADSGDITIIVTVEKLTSTHKFTWIKNIQSDSPVLVQVMAPQGDVIINGSNHVVLEAQVLHGSTIVTSKAKFQWSQYKGTGYEDLNGAIQSTLDVRPDMVSSFSPFRVAVTYNSKTYYGYWCVTDRSDPIVVDVISSLGNQLVNSVGVGAIYAMTYRNGEEIDPIKSTFFSTTPPPNPSAGTFYYQLNPSSKTVMLMKYNGSAWSTASGDDLPKGTYKWYRRDASGTPLDTEEPYATGKVIFMDATVVDKKTTFGCWFEIN